MSLTSLKSSSSSTADRTAKLAATDASSADTTKSTTYISDDSQLQPAAEEPPDLRELNACLDALAAVFPDIQIEVFRELLSSFDGESRLALAANALLQNQTTWVKGRWRVINKDEEGQRAPEKPPTDPGFPSVVPKREAFRSPKYKSAVQALAWQEFKGLSRSAISAVLAESNYAYLEARETLVNLSSKSWRYTISSFFRGGKKVISRAESRHHPLIVWKPSGHGSLVPTIRATGNAELDMELFNTLIAPLRAQEREEVEEMDHKLAVDLNNAEAEETQNMFECTCCYTESTFEEVTSCSANGHMVCYRCVQHTLTEAVFGQGFTSSVDKTTGTLCCPAAVDDECKGIIPSDQLHRAMLADKGGAEKLAKFDQRLADYSLANLGLPLIHCPFCPYTEIDDIYLTENEEAMIFQRKNICNLIILGVSLLTLFNWLPIYMTLMAIIPTVLCRSNPGIQSTIIAELRAARQRQRRRRRGNKFICRNPSCFKQSCMECNKAWVDVHVCNESSLHNLRTQIEQAMSMAVKRVCPKCNASFVKDSGCNKMTCSCGYLMCYICRKDITGEAKEEGNNGPIGYGHFCMHFREEGDGRKCKKCTKCNLWEQEDEQKVLQKAKEEAERNWKAAEKRDLTTEDRTYMATGFMAKKTGRPKLRKNEGLLAQLLEEKRLLTISEAADMVLEYFCLY